MSCMRMSLLFSLTFSLSLLHHSLPLHCQSTKTLGSIRAEQEGYDRVFHSHHPFSPSLSLSCSNTVSPPSARVGGAEQVFAELHKTREKTADHQNTSALYSLSFSQTDTHYSLDSSLHPSLSSPLLSSLSLSLSVSLSLSPSLVQG